MEIAGRVALVTGAGSGIGRAVAVELARRGASALALIDRSDSVVTTAAAINDKAGKTLAEPLEGDTTDADFRRRVFDETAARVGLPTICVPAAGITRDQLAVKVDSNTGRSRLYPIDDFRLVTEVNLIAPVYWAMEMVGRIAEDRRRRGLGRWQPEEGVRGSIVFIGSVSSRGNIGQVAYAATKAGLEGAQATLAQEAIYHGVRSAIIHPGFTNTPMVQALGEDYVAKNILPNARMHRLIEPSEIAEAVCFLISNSIVSGAIWADAGWHAPY